MYRSNILTARHRQMRQIKISRRLSAAALHVAEEPLPAGRASWH